MSESHPPFYLVDRAGFEQRLAVLGFVRLTGESEQSIWLGSVRVTWRDPHTNKCCAYMHQIKIFLGKGFPFQKPEVFPVDANPHIVGQRHQAPGTEGALCLYPDEGRGWMPEYTADDLKKRVRQWFINYHNDDWPDRDRAPDLHLYFDGGSERKLKINNIDKRLCTVHATWEFIIKELDEDENQKDNTNS